MKVDMFWKHFQGTLNIMNIKNHQLSNWRFNSLNYYSYIDGNIIPFYPKNFDYDFDKAKSTLDMTKKS